MRSLTVMSADTSISSEMTCTCTPSCKLVALMLAVQVLLHARQQAPCA